MQICFKTISPRRKTALSRTHAEKYVREIKTYIYYIILLSLLLFLLLLLSCGSCR